MEKQTILVALVALLIGGIGGYALADKNQPGKYGGMYQGEQSSIDDMRHGMGMHGAAGADQAPTMGMTGGGMGHMMDMWVESEREFLTGMIPHHQEAVDTAREVLERGATTPEIKRLVENIIVAQEREIADMKAWYEAWYGEVYADTGEYEPMMRELETLSGAELDRVFLSDMIMHHMGAIMMARSVQPHIEHQEIADLTDAIVITQSAEIAEMRQMLSGL